MAEEAPSPLQRAQFSAASVCRMINALEGLPGYVDQLEKRNKIKDMRIKHLENEVDRYVWCNVWFLYVGLQSTFRD